MLQQICLCWQFLVVIFLVSAVNAQANASETVNASVLVSDATELSTKVNETASNKNESLDTHRITQLTTESHPSTQQLGRTLGPIPVNTSKNPQRGDSKPMDFRPSPQLDTYYEYNRFPVVPAFPEAKQFSGTNLNEKPLRSETLPWLDRPGPGFPSTTQQPWYNKINFPTTQNPYLMVRDHPYPYLLGGAYPETTTRSQFSYVLAGTKYPDTTTRIQYPYVIRDSNPDATTRSPGFSSSPGFSKFGGFPLGAFGSSPGFAVGHVTPVATSGPPLGFSNKFGYDKGSLLGGKGGSSGSGGGNPLLQKTNFEHSVSTGSGSYGSPWKKIIKLLTAFIPIGLLLSALTPTVINVSPMNTTQGRGRAEETQDIATKRLISSLNYINKLNSAGCEERVICELLLNAGASSNAEKHVEHLLDTFTEQERDVIENIDELNKIFESVKTGNCGSLVCDGFKQDTESTTIANEE